MDVNEANVINHKQATVHGRSVSISENGRKGKQTILFLHGYPEDRNAFEDLMIRLKDNYHVMAIDLPGIGRSEPISSGIKRSIARFLNDLIQSLNLEEVVLVGHDIGGMLTYSYLREFPEHLYKAVIMNTAIPGVEPWEEVKRNPFIWHFALFSVPKLPETLIAGRQSMLFDYFFNTLSANNQAIQEQKRRRYVKAYKSPVSLKTSLDWYRAFPEDEKNNSGHYIIDTPVLYLKGEQDFGDIERYIDGLKKSGIQDIRGELISNCRHFAPEENPDEVASVLRDFIDS